MATNKIPAKIVKNKDNNGQYRIGLIIALEDLLSDPINIEKEIKQFELNYIKLIVDLKRLLGDTKSKKINNPKNYWVVGLLLNNFSTNNRFVIVNYADAIADDLNISKTYVRFLMNFHTFFDKNKIDERIPISHYYELIKKFRKLKKANIVDDVIRLLKEYADNNNLPAHKEFRKILSNMLKTKKTNNS